MSDLLEIRMPADQSEGTRSQVLRWLKAEGDAVSQDEPLIEMETDKVTVEIAAPHAGVLRRILKREQSDVEPGEVLGLIEAEGAAARSTAVVSADVPTKPATVMVNDEPATIAQNGTGANTDAAPSPAVHRLLSENGLSAADVVGTGVGGRITVDDVLSHIAAGPAERRGRAAIIASRAAPAGPSAQPASPRRAANVTASQRPTAVETSQPDASVLGVRRVPHSAVRKRVAEHMVRSLMHTAPHVTSVFEADMSAVIAHRARHRAAFERSGAPLTFTAYFLAAIVDAIRAVPEANSRWTDDALEIYDAIHIGVGTALGDQGLVVPVIRNVESLTLEQIATQLHDVVSRAREGALTPEDVRGGTFTISNHGVSGSLIATPIIINQPQSAILGIGKLDQRVVPGKDGSTERFSVVPKCYVTLTIDHRVMDGFQANRFLQTFVGKLESG